MRRLIAPAVAVLIIYPLISVLDASPGVKILVGALIGLCCGLAATVVELCALQLRRHKETILREREERRSHS